jgi:hypothetical protein
MPIVLVLLTPFLWLSPPPQYGQTGGLPLGIDITSRYLREAQVYKCIALQSHIVTARRHSSSGISEQQPKGLNPAAALRMNSTLPAVYASAIGPRRSVVRVEPSGKDGWQKVWGQLYPAHKPCPPHFTCQKTGQRVCGASGTWRCASIDISTPLLSVWKTTMAKSDCHLPGQPFHGRSTCKIHFRTSTRTVLCVTYQERGRAAPTSWHYMQS